MMNLTRLHDRLRPCFARGNPFTQARKYVAGLMSDLPRKNGRTIAEHAGDATPDRTPRLLNHALWDQDRAQGVIRRFVVEQLGDQPLRERRRSPTRSWPPRAQRSRRPCRRRRRASRCGMLATARERPLRTWTRPSCVLILVRLRRWLPTRADRGFRSPKVSADAPFDRE